MDRCWGNEVTMAECGEEVVLFAQKEIDQVWISRLHFFKNGGIQVDDVGGLKIFILQIDIRFGKNNNPSCSDFPTAGYGCVSAFVQ